MPCWRETDEIIQKSLNQAFDGKIALPIRYYYHYGPDHQVIFDKRDLLKNPQFLG